MRRSGNGLLLRISIIAPMLIGSRFLLAISVGTASFVAPLYISGTNYRILEQIQDDLYTSDEHATKESA